jgi:hypothetical protein
VFCRVIGESLTGFSVSFVLSLGFFFSMAFMLVLFTRWNWVRKVDGVVPFKVVGFMGGLGALKLENLGTTRAVATAVYRISSGVWYGLQLELCRLHRFLSLLPRHQDDRQRTVHGVCRPNLNRIDLPQLKNVIFSSLSDSF